MESFNLKLIGKANLIMNYPPVQTNRPVAQLSCQVYSGEISIYCSFLMRQFIKNKKLDFMSILYSGGLVFDGIGDLLEKNRGVQADEKVASEIKSVLQKFSANGAVIVSDGEDDEMVIPVIQNVIPVVSVQRVVMQVSRTIEHSYAVFGKFLKLVMYNPKYSKFFLGVPGILLLIGGIGAVTGYNAEIFAVLISILGGAFLIRAFDIDKAWANWAKPTPEGFTRMFTLITGLILIAASVPAGIAGVSTVYTSGNVEIANLLTNEIVVGQFVSGMIPFLWIGLGTIFVGILFSNWLNRKLRDRKSVV